MGNDEERLAARLGQLIMDRGLGPRSRWALKAALDAADAEGIAGVFVLKVPSRIKDRVDLTFTVGAVDVIQRWESA